MGVDSNCLLKKTGKMVNLLDSQIAAHRRSLSGIKPLEENKLYHEKAMPNYSILYSVFPNPQLCELSICDSFGPAFIFFFFAKTMESLTQRHWYFGTHHIGVQSSTDQSRLDTDIPYRLGGLAFALIQLFNIILLRSKVGWRVSPLFLVVLAISIWYQHHKNVFYFEFYAEYVVLNSCKLYRILPFCLQPIISMLRYYFNTARELARMVRIRKAPILHQFSETVVELSFNGMVVPTNQFFFDIVFFLALIILVALPRSEISPSLAGLAATYALHMNVVQSWVIWNLCNVENKMISVERILQFTNIASEAPPVIEGCRPMPKWPEEGRIKLENLHVQYNANLPMVLKGITCTFPERKKIAIVGRTGSGKSTLIQALFRVVEPSVGRILIDGVDTCSMGLHDLRSRLGIIPQGPTLFQGTIRSNLDPLQQHTDQDIWEVINKCRFVETIRTGQTILEARVAEDGEIVCLARMLLKNCRILVLDEATASIDTATENIIQETIREETNECTVITVAHRIPTIIDHDLVLVLDEGKVVEYDSPSRLLKNNSSTFSKLVAEFLRRSSNSHS